MSKLLLFEITTAQTTLGVRIGMKTITVKQRTVLKIIVNSIDKTGKSPTLRAIVPKYGATLNAVVRQVHGLEAKGFITRLDGKISLTVLGWRQL